MFFVVHFVDFRKSEIQFIIKKQNITFNRKENFLIQ